MNSTKTYIIYCIVLTITIFKQAQVVHSISKSECKEIYRYELYACPQTICPSGYRVCETTAEIESLGLTPEICENIPVNDEFFAIQQFNPDDKPNASPSDNQFDTLVHMFERMSMDQCDSKSESSSLPIVYGCSNLNSNNNVLQNKCNVLNSAVELMSNGNPNYNMSNLGVFCCSKWPYSGTGCKRQQEEIKLVEDKIYACNGGRYSSVAAVASMQGEDIYTDENIEIATSVVPYMLCTEDYHICDGAEELKLLGLPRDQCANNKFDGKFYGSLEGIDEFDINQCGNDGIYGCSENTNTDCGGILNSMINSKSLFDTDGLLCCSNKAFYGKKGCYSNFTKTEIIADKVYACSGTYENIESAERKGCGPFYHVCNSAKELFGLGMKDHQCTNIGNNDEFYATLEGIETNNNKCNTSINGVWGCSSSTNSVTDDACSPLNSVLQDGLLSDADGILCCTDGDWKDVSWNYVSYMVSLRYSSGGHGCGGSILTLDGHNGKGAILTAAHCSGIWEDGHAKVYVGCTTTKCNGLDDRDSRRVYYIESALSHPDFDIDGSNENDIAILFLNDSISHPNAVPIVIESDPMIAENNGIAKLIGYYGEWQHEYMSRAYGGSDIKTLEYGMTNIMGRDECKTYHGNSVITSNDFCVKDDIGTDGMVGTCQGDSGSPVLYKGKQLGIVSFGIGACDPFYPKVLTYVPSFLKWITLNCGADCGSGEYIGCYEDNEYDSALRHEIKDKSNNGFDIDECRDECNGYSYFALQDNGDKCFCGNNYESAIKYGFKNATCSSSKLGGILSNSLFVHGGFKQIKYLPDEQLKQETNLQYGPGNGPQNAIKYTVESCRISCSQFRYFSVDSNGACRCDNNYYMSDNDKYNKHGLFENVLPDGIEIHVNCDNFLNGIWYINDEYSDYISLQLPFGESYPFDDWTKTQKVMLPNSANCGKVKIECANAANDDGPAGLMIGIKYKNKYVSSNAETISNGVITLLSTTATENNDKIVMSSQSSTTPLSKSPFNAQWIWTCGENGEWNCGEGVINQFEIHLCELSVADNPNLIDIPNHYMPKHIIYWIFIVSVIINVIWITVFCCKSSKKYTKIKTVSFDGIDDEQNDEV